MSTIFAPLTGRGGAVLVLRLSGPEAFAIARALAGKLPDARQAGLRTLRDGGKILDHGLVTIFPAPHSFTGEDCVELSLHGGRAVLAAVTAALLAAGARPAEPGEFSRRAHANGKLDLIEAEAIADLIAAETEAQRRQALDGFSILHNACTAWRGELVSLLAQQEALIDFPDEDLPAPVEQTLLATISRLGSEMNSALAAAPAATRLRDGLEFVILGAPNAGKSTLLNALAGADIAIVSDIPGTTRDAIGARLDLAGIVVHLTDTAGLRETDDKIETEGVRRAYAKGAAADLIIAVAPADSCTFPATPPGVRTLKLVTKSDLAPAPEKNLAVSAATGAGFLILREKLAAIAAELTDTQGAAALARPRQIACVRDAAAALTAALTAPEPELRAEDLRSAATALARLTGAIGVEEILDEVFSSFCIGK